MHLVFHFKPGATELSLHNSFLLILLNFKSAWCNCSHYLPFHPWKILFDPPLVVKFLSLAVDSNWSNWCNWCNNACIKSRTLCSCNKPQWWGSEFEFLSCIKLWVSVWKKALDFQESSSNKCSIGLFIHCCTQCYTRVVNLFCCKLLVGIKFEWLISASQESSSKKPIIGAASTMRTTLHLVSLNGQFLLVMIDISRVLCILIDGHVVEISPSFSLVTIELRVKCTTFVMQYSF